MRTHLTRLALAASAVAALMPLAAGAAVDVTAPVVATPSPASAYKDAPTMYSATFTDDLTGVVSCTLYVGGVSQGSMTLTTSNGGLSGSAGRAYTYTGSATFISVQVRCTDQASTPNTGISSTRSVSILVDGTAPSVTNLQPGTASVGVATTMSANFSDAGSGVVTCWYSDNAMGAVEAAIGGGLATYSRTFPSAGVYNVFMECEDAAGNGNSVNRTVTVNAPDVTAPSVTNVLPATASLGVATTISATVTETDTGISSCIARVNGITVGTMTLGGPSFYSIGHTFTASGINEVDIICTDGAGNPGSGFINTNVTGGGSDGTAPAVTNIQPGSGVAGVGFTVTANYSDAVGVSVCEAFLTGSELGTMTLSGGVGSTSGVASMPMSYSAYGPFTDTLTVQCRDAAGNQGITTRSFSSTGANLSDAVVPTISNLQPGTATAGVATPITFTYGDNVGIGSCHLQVNGLQDDIDPTLSGGSGSSSGTASRTRTFSAGTYTILVYCEDHIGNESISLSRSLVVSGAGGADVTLPTVTGVGPTTASTGSAVTITATVADNVGVSACTLYVAGVSQGTMTVSSGVASRSHTFATAGSTAVEVRCTDAATNIGIGSATIVVSAPPAVADATLPAVGQIVQTAATAGTPITLTATASDNIGVSSCTLFVGDSSQGTMAVSGGSASRSHTFSSSGNIVAEVRCTDAAGNTGIGTSRTVTVTATAPTPTPTPTPVPISTGSDPDTDGDDLSDADEAVYGTSPTNRDSDGDGFPDGTEVRNGYNPLGAGRISPPTTSAAPGRLIKVACPTGADVSHPCKAVYYYGRDGKRHPFPSARVYFTWYNDFATVQVVDSSFLSSLALGENVLPRPGVRLIKFQTVNTVYAVDRGGILRGIVSESVAASLYGSGWGGKIDDVVDILFGNFSVGGEIASASAYSPAAATAGTTSIDGNF